MRAYLGRLLSGLTLVAGLGATATAQTDWPTPPSRLLLETPQGDLSVSASDYVYESVLQLNGDDVQPRIVGILNIPYAYNMPDFHVALVSIGKGNDGCPIAYRWIRIQKSGYSVTPEFGSCSKDIAVNIQGQLLTMTTPNSRNPDKIDSYIYDGKVVKRRLAR